MLRRASMKREQSNHFGRFSAKADFKNIYDVWDEACRKENIFLSKNVLVEFKKRIASLGKSKLNLMNCNLSDKTLTLLLDILGKRPVISKLDLSSNDISTKGAEVLMKVLRAQCLIVCNIPLDSRLTACLFGDVSLQGSSKTIDATLCDNIRLVCEALRYCNAQAHIRGTFLEQGIPEPVTTPYLLSLWAEVVGKPDRYSLLSAFTTVLKGEKSLLSYEEVERLLLQGLIDKGELVELNEWQKQLITKQASASESSVSTKQAIIQEETESRSDKSNLSTRREIEKDAAASLSLVKQSSIVIQPNVSSASSSAQVDESSNLDDKREAAPGASPSRASSTWGPVRAVLPHTPPPERRAASPPSSSSSAVTAGRQSSPRSSLKAESSTPSRNTRDKAAGDNTPVGVKTPLSSSSRAGVQSSAASPQKGSSETSTVDRLLDQFTAAPISSLAASNKRQNSMNVFLSSQNDLILKEVDLTSSRDTARFRTTGVVKAEGVLGAPTLRSAADHYSTVDAEEGEDESDSNSSSRPKVKTSPVLVIDTPSPVKRSRGGAAPPSVAASPPPPPAPPSSHLSPINRSSRQLSDSHRMDDNDEVDFAVESQSSAAASVSEAALHQYLLQKEQEEEEQQQQEEGGVKPVLAEFDSMMSALFPRGGQTDKHSHHTEAEEQEEEEEGLEEGDVEVDPSRRHSSSSGDDKYSPSEYIVIPPPSKWSLMSVLVQDHKGLTAIDFSAHLDPEQFSALRVLVLRDNQLSELTPLKLGRHFKFVSDLDLSYNLLHGVILKNSLPRALLRLDLSHNEIVDVSGLMLCVQLVELNLSHNLIKRFDGLPVTLKKLDLSHNLVSSLISLRALSLSDKLTTLMVAHNPVVKSQPTQYKVLLRSILINLIELDGELQVKQKLQLRKRETEQQHSMTVFETQQRAATVRVAQSQQKANDKLRTQLHELKMKALDQTKQAKDSKEAEEQRQRTKRVIPARAAAELSNRLSGSSITAAKGRAAAHKANTSTAAPLDLSRVVLPANSLVQSYMNIRRAVDADPATADLPLEDMSEEINEWLSKKQYEASKAAALIKMCCDLCHSGSATTPTSAGGGGRLNEKTVQSVLKAVRRLDCYKAANYQASEEGTAAADEQGEEQLFLLRVDYFLSRCSSSSHKAPVQPGLTPELAADVSAVREQSQRLGQFFSQLESILLQSIASSSSALPSTPSHSSAGGAGAVYVFTYTKLFNALMASPLGEYVNRTVLLLHNGDTYKPLNVSTSFSFHNQQEVGGRAVSPVRSSKASTAGAAAPLKDLVVKENLSHNMSNLLAEDDKQQQSRPQQQQPLSSKKGKTASSQSASKLVKPIVAEPTANRSSSSGSIIVAAPVGPEDDLTMELSELLTVSDNDVIIDKMKERVRSRITTPSLLHGTSSSAAPAAPLAVASAVAAAVSLSLSSLLSSDPPPPAPLLTRSHSAGSSHSQSSSSLRVRSTSTPPPPPPPPAATTAVVEVLPTAILDPPVVAKSVSPVEPEVVVESRRSPSPPPAAAQSSVDTTEEELVESSNLDDINATATTTAEDKVESRAGTPPHSYANHEEQEIEEKAALSVTATTITATTTTAAAASPAVLDVIDTVLTMDSCDEDLAGVKLVGNDKKGPIEEDLKEPLPSVSDSKPALSDSAPVLSPSSSTRRTVKPPSVDGLLAKAASSPSIVNSSAYKAAVNKPAVPPSISTSSASDGLSSILASGITSPVKAALSKFNTHNFSQHIPTEASPTEVAKKIIATAGDAAADGYVYASVKDRAKARLVNSEGGGSLTADSGSRDSSDPPPAVHVPAPPLMLHLLKSKSNSSSSVGGGQPTTAVADNTAPLTRSSSSGRNNNADVTVQPSEAPVVSAAGDTVKGSSGPSAAATNYFVPVEVKEEVLPTSVAAVATAVVKVVDDSASSVVTTATAASVPVSESADNSRPTSALSGGGEGKLSAKERILARQAANKKAKQEANTSSSSNVTPTPA